jgi:hypothetical protein
VDLTTTKELLEAELEKLTDEDLAELLTVARGLSDAKAKPRKAEGGLLAKLQEISIDAPEDFAASFDLYLSGEKKLDDGQDVP